MTHVDHSLFAVRARRTHSSKKAVTAIRSACMIEALEVRQMLSMSVGINFQPSGAAVPAGYLADTGATYASRGNGQSYGWNASASSTSRDRNVNSDQRYDTLIHTQLYGTFTWEMAVPNGTYQVRGVAGDAANTDSVYRYNVEGQTLLSGTPTSTNKFVQGTATVTVTDGRLTLSNAAGASNNKIAFLEITQPDAPSTDAPTTTTTTSLSDLAWVSATNGSGPVEKDRSVGGSAAGDGGALTLDGVTYSKGLGVQATSQIVYNLNGKYDNFISDIGLDATAGTRGSVVFRVLADGVRVYDSDKMYKSTPHKTINLAVKGVTQLTLVVTGAGNGTTGDRADWAGARLVAAATAPASPVPAAPADLTARALSSTQVGLTWSDRSSDETGFRVERSTDGTTFTTLATVGAGVTSYTDTTVAATTTYTYRVIAVNAAGSSLASGVASVTTPAPAPTVPVAASNLAGTALSPTQVKLTWADNSSNETGFRVERSTDGTNFSAVGTVGAGVVTYTDTNAAASTSYTYRVVAYGVAGDASVSNTTSVTTPAAATPAITASWIVSATGSDTNAGTTAAPFKTVAKAMSMAQPGQTILIKNGTYHERLTLTKSGLADKPITLMGESTSGVVFDGSGFTDVLTANGAQYITVSNMTFRHAANGPQNYQAAIRTGSNWTLKDMVVEKVDGTAICAKGSNVVIQRVIAQDNGVAGIGSDGANGLLVKDSITRRNNNGMVNPVWKDQATIGGWGAARQVNGLWYMHPDFEAGGGKYWASTNVTIDNLQAHDNIGPGIWFDYQSKNVTIRNSKAWGNRGLDSSKSYQGNGIRLELQDVGPFLLENNLIYNNSGAAISIEQARNITIRNNTLVGGIVFRDDPSRGVQYAVYNVTITGNQIKNGKINTWEGTWNTSSGATKRIVIDGNTYDSTSALFSWAGTSYTSLSSIRSTLGFEATGKVAPITVTY